MRMGVHPTTEMSVSVPTIIRRGDVETLALAVALTVLLASELLFSPHH